MPSNILPNPPSESNPGGNKFARFKASFRFPKRSASISRSKPSAALAIKLSSNESPLQPSNSWIASFNISANIFIKATFMP